jgi:hypothetical protein
MLLLATFPFKRLAESCALWETDVHCTDTPHSLHVQQLKRVLPQTCGSHKRGNSLVESSDQAAYFYRFRLSIRNKEELQGPRSDV